MKTNKVVVLASIVVVGLTASVQAGGHHGDSGSTASAPVRSAGPSFRSGPGPSRYGGGPMISRSQHFSSYRAAVSGQRRFTPGGVTGSYNPARFANARSRNLVTSRSSNHFNSSRNGNRSLAQGRNHLFGRRSASWHRDWDRGRDHFWNGHRCRFVNGSWFIFDLGFFPWDGYPYDYYASDYYYPYPYGYGYGNGYGYGYGQGPGVYEGGNPYDGNQPGADESSNNDQNSNTDSPVAATQERLARQGYYRGEIDGVLGPATRHALISYQRRNGLRATGSLTPETLQSLNLGTVARD